MISIRSLTGGLLAALVIFVVSQADAQTKFKAPPPKIAIVDVQAVMREAKAAKSARDQMNAIARKEQTTFAAEEKKLRAKDQELLQQRSLLTPEVYAQRQQALQVEVGRLQRRSRDLRLALDQGFKSTMERIQLIMIDEIRKISSEFDLNLVVPRSQIVLAVDDYDITRTTLERLDKRLPSIELKLEKRENTNKGK